MYNVQAVTIVDEIQTQHLSTVPELSTQDSLNQCTQSSYISFYTNDVILKMQ